ncbi:MAG: FtsX-like permease family protein [Sporomusaceae bacterium]|nr:FtsX-like permease family protein [Sporomusaceae bacterium]
MIRLIWKSLWHRRLQTLAILVGIAVGVGIVFSVAALYRGVAAGMRLSQERMGADIVVVPFGVTIEPSLILFGGAAANSYMPAGIADRIRSIPGVRRATPQFFTHTLTADCHDIGNANRMLGYDPASDWIVAPWLSQAQKTALADDEVILGAKIPLWSQNHIMILGKQYQIAAVAEATGTTLDYSLFVNMAEARRVVAKTPRLNSIWEKQGEPSGLISTVLVQLDAGADIDRIADAIRGAGLVQPIVAAEVKNRINAQFRGLLWLLGGVGALAVAAALFQLFSRFYTLTWERQAEWGLYLALGASGRDIAVIIAGEAVAVALAGSLAGLLLGGSLYAAALAVLEAHQSFPFVSPDWRYFVVSSLALAGIFTGLGAVAAWLPARQGSRLDPSTIMTRGEFD